MPFTKAKRTNAKLRLAITGTAGSGKTYGALLIAKGLEGKIAVIDTECGSASLYSHIVDFDVCNLTPPFDPRRYIQKSDSLPFSVKALITSSRPFSTSHRITWPQSAKTAQACSPILPSRSLLKSANACLIGSTLTLRKGVRLNARFH